MRMWILALAALASLAILGCKDKAPPPEPAKDAPAAGAAAAPGTVQIEEQQVKVMTDPNQVKQEVEGTIEAGLKARERQMGE
ncbi:MAG TPA: hypothetical protein PK668_23635 [Myxococcota bacterium]|nr:hypothetical protein [Myxococcota bacterium]HRY96457.1 hypothetical protein [Myxococcota bacterium]HSA23926.1 hypothetical protein [Myxococcota bacterium]